MNKTEDLMQIAQDIIDTNQSYSQEQTQEYQGLFAELTNMKIGDDITKPILALLSLPDKDFKAIAPIVLLDFNKNFHDSNNQLLMLQTFNASDYTLEDLKEEIDQLLEDIKHTEFSQEKQDFLSQIFMDMFNAVSEIKGIPKKIIQVPLEICHENAKIPCYANPTDSGMDVYALEDITINPGETKLIPTGLKVAIPVGYEIQVRPKSGRALKTKLRVANTPGTIDAGYRDEIGVIIDNIDPPIKKIYTDENGRLTGIDYGSSYTIGKGEKFAQLVLCQVSHCAFNQIDAVSAIENDGRNGGYGSTGLK